MESLRKVIFYFILYSGVKAENLISVPGINLSFTNANQTDSLVTSLQILFLLTILSLAPSIIIMTTSFIRTVVVLHFIRQALGLQQMPPNQVLIGLALFLTFFIMRPTYSVIFNDAINPYIEKKINQEEMLKKLSVPMKEFMLKNTKVKDLELFLKASKEPIPKSRQDISILVVIPAYIISELSRGFEMGVLIFIPFIIIDMVVATVLMSLGMMMLPPVMISLPFKLLLFIMVDGWSLIIDSLIKSFN